MAHTRPNQKVLTLGCITVTKEHRLAYHVSDIFRVD